VARPSFDRYLFSYSGEEQVKGFVLFIGAALLPAFAQQSVTGGVVSGMVENAAGEGIASAVVSAHNLATNQNWKVLTDDAGRFRFPFLPASQYEVRVESPSFATVTHQFSLSVGQALDLPVRLTLTGSAEHIEVTADVPVVELTRTQIAETVSTEEINSLPLNGRNYLDLALLVPGVSRTNTGSVQRFAETSAVPGTGISVSGQRNLNNTFLLDGLSLNDDAAGLAGSFYSQEVVREFQMVTAGGGAEFGRTSSGVINIITRSGTNDWHGRFYGFLRNQRLDARNPIAKRKDPLTQGQFGASVSGPLRRGNTFFFSNFEHTRQNGAGFVTISPGSAAAINSVLGADAYLGPRVGSGEFPTRFSSTNFFGRLDHQAGSHLLAARYSLYSVSSTNARNAGGLNDTSRGTGLDDRDHTVALSDVATISPRAISEFRLQFTHSSLDAAVNDLTGPAVNVAGIASFGTATSSPTSRVLSTSEASESVSFRSGAHAWKAGGNFLYNSAHIEFPGALQGVYSFSSLANFRAGRYVTFQQAFGQALQSQSNPNAGAFIQDEWRVARNLTVNAGLRYDVQFLPSPMERDTRGLAPRIGIAYAPGDHKTVIRVGFGLFYDTVPLRAVSNALQRDGTQYKVAVLPFGTRGAPVFPNVLPAFPAGILTSITTIDPHIRDSYSHQSELQIERELTPSTSISAGYLHLRGLRVIISRNVNVPTVTAAEAAERGIPNLGRPDPRFGNVSRYESAGDSYYDGFTFAFQKRAGQRAGLRLSYTLSKTIDTAGNFFFSSPQDNFNLRDDRGLSDNDQRHRVVASGFLQAPHRAFEFGYIFSYNSSLPFNIVTGTDRNHDTNVNDRPPGIGRNTGRGFDYASLDLRVSRQFRLAERVSIQALVEGFNILNRANWQIPNNVYGAGTTPSPGFGAATAAADPRQVQIGLRIDF
jgi:hypothetical protein